jgi:hypothetical protein
MHIIGGEFMGKKVECLQCCTLKLQALAWSASSAVDITTVRGAGGSSRARLQNVLASLCVIFFPLTRVPVRTNSASAGDCTPPATII